MINLWGSVFTYFLEFILHLLTCNTKDAVLAELSLGHPSGGLAWTSRIYSWCLIVVVIQTQISKVFSFLFQIAFNFLLFLSTPDCPRWAACQVYQYMVYTVFGDGNLVRPQDTALTSLVETVSFYTCIPSLSTWDRMASCLAKCRSVWCQVTKASAWKCSRIMKHSWQQLQS